MPVSNGMAIYGWERHLSVHVDSLIIEPQPYFWWAIEIEKKTPNDSVQLNRMKLHTSHSVCGHA